MWGRRMWRGVRRMTWIGVGYRRALAQWIERRPPEVECLELTAEHFFDCGQAELRALSSAYPLFVHGLGLSLGTPGPLDPETLHQFAGVVKSCNPRWVSEHIAFTRTSEIDLGHLNPLRPTRSALKLLAAHARELAELCEKPVILENITSNLRMDGDLSETDFLNQLCASAGCGLLLDVTNLLINARNHGFDPRHWLHEIEPRHIVQLHIVGYSVGAGGRLEDSHAEPVQDDLLAMLQDVLAYAPVQAVILERDEKLECSAEIAAELSKLRSARGTH